jgi:alkanesulfonate monooxygenase SsuD/methylene tetrahydromethanopterin reductase-like flavin-dependent oxidoreductase (luciferase family)
VEIGVVLPNGVPGTDPKTVLAWAREAERGPFHSVSVADRLAYANLDALMTFAAVAAVTDRVRLVTNALLTPLHNTAHLAKQVATLSQLAPGRLSLGVAVGARQWDYHHAGVPWERRGQILDEQLDFLQGMKAERDEQQLGPMLHPDTEILIGGASPPALRRMIKHADGFISGGVKPELFQFELMATLGAWREAGREGEPRVVAGQWYSSSEDLDDEASAYLESYLYSGGPPLMVNAGIVRGKDAIRERVAAFRSLGADEVILFPCVSGIAELEFLADVVESMPDVPKGSPFPPSGPPPPPPEFIPGTASGRVGVGIATLLP